MLPTVVFFLLLGLATYEIEFLSPPSGQDFATNDTILIKWKKVAGASNYTISGGSCNGIVDAFKGPSKCKPRLSIGPLQEGDWNVSVVALNQSGDIIDSGMISFRVCASLPCPNGTETDADCAIGQVLRYYTSPGYKVQEDSPNSTFKTDDEQQCLVACSKNTQPNATPAPCKSVDFNKQTNTCEVYAMVTFPQGNVTLTNDSTTNHYEKVCVDAAIGCRCPGPYFVEPQMELRSTKMAYLYASDINDCFLQCDELGRSGLFYPEDAITNCVINAVATRSTNSDIYLPATGGYKVNYFEPGCTK